MLNRGEGFTTTLYIDPIIHGFTFARQVKVGSVVCLTAYTNSNKLYLHFYKNKQVFDIEEA